MPELWKDEFNQVCEVLSNFGIETYNKDGTVRYFNEVMIDIATFFRKRREEVDKKTYYIEKTAILEAILGERYVNEFLI